MDKPRCMFHDRQTGRTTRTLNEVRACAQAGRRVLLFAANADERVRLDRLLQPTLHPDEMARVCVLSMHAKVHDLAGREFSDIFTDHYVWEVPPVDSFAMVFELAHMRRRRHPEDGAAAARDRIRRLLALRYHIETEEYDRTLPGVWLRPDEWMPHTGEPTARSRANAREVRRLREIEAAENGITVPELQREVQEAARLGLVQQKRELDALLGRVPQDVDFSAARAAVIHREPR